MWKLRPLTPIFGTGTRANGLGKMRCIDNNWEFFFLLYTYSPLDRKLGYRYTDMIFEKKSLFIEFDTSFLMKM